MFISRRSLVYTLTVLIIVAVSVTLISASQGKSGRGAKKGKKQVTALDKKGELMSGRAMEADLSGMEGYGGFTGTGSPPRVSTNVQVNDPQAFFPGGLVGRSENSIVTLQGGTTYGCRLERRRWLLWLPVWSPVHAPAYPWTFRVRLFERRGSNLDRWRRTTPLQQYFHCRRSVARPRRV